MAFEPPREPEREGDGVKRKREGNEEKRARESESERD
jgi:hypothetical protein